MSHIVIVKRTHSAKPVAKPGWVLVDATTALAILLILLGVMSVVLNGLRTFNHYQLARQRCISAASAQLDSIAATGEPLAEGEMKKLWPGVRVAVTSEPGTGDWQGLQLTRTIATSRSFKKDVIVELCRYVPVSTK